MNNYMFNLKYPLILLALFSSTTLAMEDLDKDRKQSSPTTSHRLSEEDMSILRATLKETVETDLGQRYEKEAEEDFEQHFKVYHERAVRDIKQLWNNNPPKLGSGFMATIQDQTGPSAAIANLEQVITQNPIPSEPTWSVRGWVKKYNEALLVQFNNSINQQKTKYRQDLYMQELEMEMLGGQ